jgi:hypothetical protein
MTDDDPIAAIRAELLQLRRDFEAHRSMPPAVQGETLDRVIRERDEAVDRGDAIRAQNEILASDVARLLRERDAARADAADARAALKRRDEVTSQIQAEILRLRQVEMQNETLRTVQWRREPQSSSLAPPPTWRREPPSSPGWYWYCDSQLSVRIEHWDAREIEELGRMGLDPPHRPRWAGPLPYPEKEA